MQRSDRLRPLVLSALGLAGALLLNGCAVVSVASTAVSVGAGAVGLAADAAIGTARITGKVVGAAADAVIPDSKD
ncbi:MAG: hypothetical protein V4645_26755 [Pseudomonadota bacterium]